MTLPHRITVLIRRFSVLAVLLCATTVNAAGEPLILGVFPRFAATTTHEAFAPLAQYLSEELQREVRLETAKDQNAFWDGVVARRYDIVHFNQMNYVEAHGAGAYDVLAMNEEFGKSTISSALVVRRDSGIERIEQLRGRTINFGGGPKAMVAYVANTAVLRRAGLTKNDYKEEFSKNPANAIMAVYYKKADAGGAGEAGFKVQGLDEKVDVAEMTILATSDPLPHLPWAIKRSLGDDAAQRARAALLKLNTDPRGADVLKRAQLTALRPATDADYDVCRKMIGEVAGGK